MSKPVVGIIMGSDSDLDIMSGAAKTLDEFGVAYEVRVISAHRTPDAMIQYANQAAANGLQVIIAGAGGSAHLPGMTASETTLPVIAILSSPPSTPILSPNSMTRSSTSTRLSRPAAGKACSTTSKIGSQLTIITDNIVGKT
jgi:5-(carboxyamino)imidazole ribonucleotide mutase